MLMDSLSQSTCKNMLTDLDYLGLCHMFNFFWTKTPSLRWTATAFKEYYSKICFIANFPAQLFCFFCFGLPHVGLILKKNNNYF